MAGQAIKLNRVELPSMSDLAKTDDIELQGYTENTVRSIQSLIEQFEGTSSETLPMCEFQGLDKQHRSIWGFLKVEVVKKVELQQHIV